MRFLKYFQIGCVCCVLYTVSPSGVIAQETPQVPLRAATAGAPRTANSYTPEMKQKYFEGVARGYKIKTTKGEELKLRDQPLMHTQNPQAVSEITGTIFLWETKTGRPAIIQNIFCFWRIDRMRCRHEMISLIPQGLQAEFDSEIVWQPEGDSIKFTKMTDVQAPAANATRRLLQMRQIAKDFSGEVDILGQPVAKLTLLPTPLHRYESPEENVVDGAIFSLAVSTDADILLIFEARKEADGTMSWYWSAARAHYQALNLSYKGTNVWSAKREMGLQLNGPAEMPYAKQDYFTMTPRVEMPLPEQLK